MSRGLVLIAALPPLPLIENTVTVEAIAEKENALAASALIGKVENREQNDAATEARKRIKGLAGDFDRERKRITDPLVEMQRTFIRTVEPHIDELKREDGRLELLQKEFALAEQRRVREEQLAQQRELQRIEADRQKALANATPEQAAVLTEVINENAALKSRIESKPVEVTRSRGQTNRKFWRITQINDFQLLKARPDLVRKIEWDVVGIKQILDAGQTLPGVTAEEDLKISTRGNAKPLIDV